MPVLRPAVFVGCLAKGRCFSRRPVLPFHYSAECSLLFFTVTATQAPSMHTTNASGKMDSAPVLGKPPSFSEAAPEDAPESEDVISEDVGLE